MIRPTPMIASPVIDPTASVPRDRVCQFETPELNRILLVYYDSTGQPTFEEKAPRGVNVKEIQARLLRWGRAWESAERRKTMRVIG